MNTTATIYIIYNFSLYITLNLDYQTVNIKIANGTILKI